MLTTRVGFVVGSSELDRFFIDGMSWGLRMGVGPGEGGWRRNGVGVEWSGFGGDVADVK